MGEILKNTKMVCPICGDNHWENVDQYRFKAQGMSICLSCGFISYPNRWKTEEEIKQHYRKDYRNPPTSGNLYSGQRKLHFHAAFLKDLFEEWQKNGKKAPEIYELGAAYGMALAWARDTYKGAIVGGTELTTSYRRNAFHEYGITLTEDFDDSKQYDLIMSYKVAEHQLDIDKMLSKYKSCLKSDGKIYISVPCWFGQMNNFGLGGFDLEYYYDPNHINVWTRKLFESLMKKVGLKILKEDHAMYDSTYLVEACEPQELTKDDFENIDEIKIKLDHIKQAYILFTENRFDECIERYPDFPTAHVSRIEMMRKQAFQYGWEWIKEHLIERMFKECSPCAEIWTCAADLAMRAKQWDEAIRFAEGALVIKPGNPVSLGQLINIMREIAISSDTDEKKLHYFDQARNIAKHLRAVSLQNAREAIDFIYLFNSQLPIPSEIKNNK